MADDVPQIFDRKRLARNRGRAAQATGGFGAHDFLLRHIGNELTDRIAGVARDFSTGLCLGSSGGIIEAVRAEQTKKGHIDRLFHADLSAYLVPNDGCGLVCDEERLPFAEARFDLVVALWGLHHVNDLPGALIQIRQILKPDGFFLAALPGGRTLESLRHALVAAETELLPGVRPHVHPFPDLADLSGLLQRAGFALPVADSHPVEQCSDGAGFHHIAPRCADAGYDKIHMFDVTLPNGEVHAESQSYKAGTKADMVEVDDVRIGLSICYDMRFPAMYRALARAGAQVLSVPSAFTQVTGEAHWHVLLRARAIENGAYVLAPAQNGTHENGRQTFGHTLIVDPWGTIIAEAGADDDFVMAELDMAAVDKARRALPVFDHGRAFSLSEAGEAVHD
eukprot:gene4055-biopygen588